ncbi:MAG: ABC transporter substrate-binding protein [Actinomycetes bacterium]|nr:ABC transporter substrate-binding protein [Acidimicrobiia bacterium]
MKTHKHWRAVLLLAVVALIAAACGGDGTEDTSIPITSGDEAPATTADTGDAGDTDSTEGEDGDTGSAEGGSMTMLIGSSGDAETNAVQAAVDAWGEESGVSVEVIAANDLTQQLGQGFSGGNPPDIFYMSWDQFQTYAANGYLEPYAEELSNADAYYQSLRDTFTYDGTFYCAPKDFSTLGLVINTDAWEEAGLTDDDIPTNWDELAQVAEALTTDSRAGLSFGLEYARIGVFMNQAGGSLVSEDGTTATADSPENLQALEYVQSLVEAGSLRFPSELGAGWAGEAFGQQTAAMVIEGPWINGALANDYPDVNYRVVELPEGPAGPSTFVFTNCWGIPAGSETRDLAVDLVEFLTSDEQQLAFSEAFGVIPSTESAAAVYAEQFPENEAFVAGNDYSVSPIAFAGAAEVIADFNASLEGFATGGDAQTILTTLQANLQAALDAANAG